MSDRNGRRFDLMQSESCWCQFPSQLYFPVVICDRVSFQQSQHGNMSLTWFIFLPDKDLPINGRLYFLNSCVAQTLPKVVKTNRVIGRFCDRDRNYFPISAFFFLSQTQLMVKFSFCICTALLDLNKAVKTCLDEIKHLTGKLAK